MPDTPTEDQAPQDDGRLHAEDIAKAIKLAPIIVDMAGQGGDPLGWSEGLDVLAKRIPPLPIAPRSSGVGTVVVATNTPDFNRIVADYIYKALPENLRTEAVLKVIDVRPYIEYMKTHQDKAVHVIRDAGPMSPGGDSWKVLSSEVFDVALTKLNTQYDEGFDKSTFGGSSSPQEVAADRQAMNSYVPTMAGIAPDAKLKTSDGMGVAQGSVDPATLDFTTGDGAPTISASSVIDLYRADLLDPGTYNQALAELQNAEQQGGTDLPVVIQRGGETGSMRPGAGKKMSVWEARNSIYSMKPKEIEQLTKNLTDAGVFDRLGAAPDDPNDAFDPVLNKAWDFVLSQSIGRNTPVNDWLKSEAGTYRAKKAAEYKAPTEASAITEMNFNQMAQNIIGRNLDAHEMAMLRGYVIRLDKQRQTQVVGDSNFVASSGDATTDSSADVANWIGRTMPQEVNPPARQTSGGGVLGVLKQKENDYGG